MIRIICALITLASAAEDGKYVTDCFQRGEAYGSVNTTNDYYVTDEVLLRTKLFSPGMLVDKVKICGSFDEFDGIQLFLIDPADDNTLQLNPIG